MSPSGEEISGRLDLGSVGGSSGNFQLPVDIVLAMHSGWWEFKCMTRTPDGLRDSSQDVWGGDGLSVLRPRVVSLVGWK